MAIEHSYKEYQKRKQKEREVLDRSNDNERHGPRPATQFQPRAVKVKKEPEEEMDFKTRMKMMQNSKAAPKKTIFGIKKENIKEEPGVKRKKKRRKRYSSSSDDSEEEDRRLTRKAKKKLGLSDSEEEIELTHRERDARTVIATQLSHKIRERDLKDFFSSVGDVRAVKLVKDEIHKTQGLAYIEFKHVQSVPLAMGLTGQRVLGRAIVIHHSQADKNRHSEKLEQARQNLMKKGTGPYKLKVSNIHETVTEEQLKMIMEPFGRIEKVMIIKDGFTGLSSGVGFVTFIDVADGKDAIRHLNNFDLGGLILKVICIAEGKAAREHEHDIKKLMIEQSHNPNAMQAMLEYGKKEKPKMIEGVKYEPVKSVVSAAGSGYTSNSKAAQRMAARRKAAPINTQCFQMQNVFDPNAESGTAWIEKLKGTVIQRISNYGPVCHVHVDKNAMNGTVYVKCGSSAICQGAVNGVHGKNLNGRTVTAAYVPIPNYHQLFPESAMANSSL